jgi:hypothetical protein
LSEVWLLNFLRSRWFFTGNCVFPSSAQLPSNRSKHLDTLSKKTSTWCLMLSRICTAHHNTVSRDCLIPFESRTLLICSLWCPIIIANHVMAINPWILREYPHTCWLRFVSFEK